MNWYLKALYKCPGVLLLYFRLLNYGLSTHQDAGRETTLRRVSVQETGRRVMTLGQAASTWPVMSRAACSLSVDRVLTHRVRR